MYVFLICVQFHWKDHTLPPVDIFFGHCNSILQQWQQKLLNRWNFSQNSVSPWHLKLMKIMPKKNLEPCNIIAQVQRVPIESMWVVFIIFYCSSRKYKTKQCHIYLVLGTWRVDVHLTVIKTVYEQSICWLRASKRDNGDLMKQDGSKRLRMVEWRKNVVQDWEYRVSSDTFSSFSRPESSSCHVAY